MAALSHVWRPSPQAFRLAALALPAVLLLALAGCRGDDAATPTASSHEEAPAHWGYEGDVAPERWGALDGDYEQCASGREQSPVNLSIAGATPVERDLTFDYRPSALAIVNNGHTVQVVYDEGSVLTVDGEEYRLLQFHAHAASEHTIDDVRYPLEIHLVHRSAAGELAVVGVLLSEGAENAALAPFFANLPAEEGEEVVRVNGERIDAAAFLPDERDVFAYAGSLTTPPCAEGVRWFVMAEPVEVSAEQIERFTALYPDNFRPLQPLHERELQMDDDEPQG